MAPAFTVYSVVTVGLVSLVIVVVSIALQVVNVVSVDVVFFVVTPIGWEAVTVSVIVVCITVTCHSKAFVMLLLRWLLLSVLLMLSVL